MTHFISKLMTIIIGVSLCACAPQTKNTSGVKEIQKKPQEPPIIKRGTVPPILCIDTRGHMAKIGDVAFTKDGKYLVSVSDDKTIRVWDIETGEISRVIRGQIGEGHEGKIFAAALSPDNQWIAVGGYFKDNMIRLINFCTGETTNLLKGHDNVILDLAFSPDSRRLISGSSDKTARIWDMKIGKTTLSTLNSHTEEIYAVAFSPDSKMVVTGSNDDTLILWNVQTGERITQLTGHTDNVVSAAFTPDGKYLLSGSFDKTIRLWDGKTGAFIKVLAEQDTTVDSLSITPDGKYVLTGSGSGTVTTSHILSIPDGNTITYFSKHKDLVFATAISPDGKLAATGGGSEKEIYLWNISTGILKQTLVGKGKRVWSVGFKKNSSTIAWGKTSWDKDDLFLGRGELEQSFHLGESDEGFCLSLGEKISPKEGKEKPSLKKGEKKSNSSLKKGGKKSSSSLKKGKKSSDPSLGKKGDSFEYILGIESVNSISIRTEDGQINPTLQICLKGKVKHEITRSSEDGYNHRSLTLTPDGKIVISGGMDGVLTSYDTNTGTKLHDFIGHTGDIYGVAVSSDGKWLISGSDDQTVKIWDIDSGKNLLTVFHATDNEWVAWTPEGYYDCSVKGDQYIGWHMNQGEYQSALYFQGSQFADQFRNPLLVAACLETNGDLDKAIALAESRQKEKHEIKKIQASDIIQFLPPNVFFNDPKTDMETELDKITVEAGAQSLTDESISDIWFTLNGTRGVVVKMETDSNPLKTIDGKTASLKQYIPLDPGRNQIAVFASTKSGTSQPKTLTISRTSAPSQVEDIYKPNLYILSIGVSDYANSSYNLKVAHKDAEAVAYIFSGQEGKLYLKANIRLLTNKKATFDNILDGLEWISKESTQKDVSIIFLAGHGENDDVNNYYFIPHDGDFKNMRRTCVKWSDFQDVVSRLPSKTLMMVDTCRSGNITGTRRGSGDITEALRDLIQASPGLIVMAASTGRESSFEKPEWGHGAFTKALVEGLRDFKADFNKNGSLEIKELDLYVTDRVKELTGGSQHTTTEIPQIMPNFPLLVK